MTCPDTNTSILTPGTGAGTALRGELTLLWLPTRMPQIPAYPNLHKAQGPSSPQTKYNTHSYNHVSLFIAPETMEDYNWLQVLLLFRLLLVCFITGFSRSFPGWFVAQFNLEINQDFWFCFITEFSRTFQGGLWLNLIWRLITSLR